MARKPMWRARLAAVLVSAMLGGCAATGPGADPNFVYSFADRYPLTSARVDRLDVSAFQPAGNDTLRLARFARDYRVAGQGKVVIFVPQSGAQALSSGNWVRQELIAQGISPTKIQWDARPMPAGTVRVAFASNSAAKGWDCTNLNEDIQQERDQTGYLNREYINYGCAYQSNMRAQMDNPHDVIAPRHETPMDPVLAANAVRRVRAEAGAKPAATGTSP